MVSRALDNCLRPRQGAVWTHRITAYLASGDAPRIRVNAEPGPFPEFVPLAWAIRAFGKKVLDAGRHLESGRLPQMDFTDRHASNGAATIHKIDRRPVFVAERPPVPEIVVQEVREIELMLAHVRRHRRTHMLEGELVGMHAHDRQAPQPIPTKRIPDPANRAGAVDSAKRPDVKH